MSGEQTDQGVVADQSYDDLREGLGDPDLGAELLDRALTHRSFAYENGGLPTNERLEFLGDAVLGWAIADIVYHRYDVAEGQLTDLRKSVVNAIALAPAEDFRHDSDLFGEGVRDPEAQSRIRAAMKRGLQTRDAEMALAGMLGD